MSASLLAGIEPASFCHSYAPTDAILQEMTYAANLLLRAEQAIAREFDVLRAGGVVIDWNASGVVSTYLVRMSAQLNMLALQCAELRTPAFASGASASSGLHRKDGDRNA